MLDLRHAHVAREGELRHGLEPLVVAVLVAGRVALDDPGLGDIVIRSDNLQKAFKYVLGALVNPRTHFILIGIISVKSRYCNALQWCY